MERVCGFRQSCRQAVVSKAAFGGCILSCLGLVILLTALSGCRGPQKGEKEGPGAVVGRGKVGGEVSEGKSGRVEPTASSDAEAGRSSRAPDPGLADAEEDRLEEDQTELADRAGVTGGESGLETSLKLLRDRAEGEITWMRGLLSREEALKKELGELLTEMERMGASQAIPESQDDAKVEAEWRGLAQVLGFEIEKFLITRSIIENRALPGRIPADKELELTVADVRSVYQVVVTIPRPDDAGLKRLLDGVAGFQRLTLVRLLRSEPGSMLRINAEVYQFGPTDVPVPEVPERTLERTMAQLGINLTVSDAVRKDPIGYVQTASLAYQEYAASRKKAGEVAQLEARVNWLRHRLAFLKLKQREVKAVTPERAWKGLTVGAE